MQLPVAFDTFYEKISLGKPQNDRIQSAAGGLIEFLTDTYGLTETDVFLQGSYPNGTAVKPADADGEYDVDLICVAFSPDATANDALERIERALAENGNYAPHLRGDDSRKTPCVRLFYADDTIGGFHVDIVPARPSESADPEASLEAARRDQGWQDTNPREYTTWCLERGERFSRTVKMLKRWRDHQQDVRRSIKSIVLQVLAAEHLGTASSDAEALISTLESIQTALAPFPDEPPVISNPALAKENLAKRWTAPAYKDFRKHLDAAVDLANGALAEGDLETCHNLWRDLLGPDFPKFDSADDAARAAAALPTTPAPGFHDVRVPPRRNEYGS